MWFTLQQDGGKVCLINKSSLQPWKLFFHNMDTKRSEHPIIRVFLSWDLTWSSSEFMSEMNEFPNRVFLSLSHDISVLLTEDL